MPDILPEANLKCTHGPIDRSFFVKDGSVDDLKNLKRRIEEVIRQKLDVKLAESKKSGRNMMLRYASPHDPYFNTTVSMYLPENSDGMQIVGIHVYASDSGKRDEIYEGIKEIIFNNKREKGFVEEYMPTFLAMFKWLRD